MAATGSTNRVAGVWYNTTWYTTVGVSGTHQVALYLLDINNNGFAETITLSDASSGTVLDTRTASSFANGVYYVWNVSGNVKITFTSTAGHWAVLSGIFYGGSTGSTAPSPVSNLTATAGQASVLLNWSPSSGATSYNIYRGTTPGGESTTPIATGITSPTTYTDTSVTAGTTYYYEVVGLNAVGGSGTSNEVSAAPTAATAMVQFVKTDTTTEGNWKGVYGADGWNVFSDGSSNNPTNPAYLTTVPAAPAYTGTWYSSSLSPVALQVAAASSGNRVAGVWYNTSWSTTIGISGVHQVALYLMDINNNGFAETITLSDASSGTVLDTRSASSFAGGEYYVWNFSGNVKITFTSTAGHWAVLNGLFFGPGSGSSAPSAPTVTTTPGANQVALSWTASSGATTYNIYRGTTSGGESTTPIATVSSGTTYTNTGLTAGSTYYYEVVAINAVGGSFASNEASGSTTPTTPTGLGATAGSGQVQLSWTATAGATSYNIYRGLASGQEGASPIGNQSNPGATAYTDSNLSNDVTFYYKIAAVNAGGTSPESSEVSAITIAPPSNVAASSGNSQITLNWTAVPNATSYDVYRGTTSGGEGSTPYASGITTIPFLDTAVTNGQAYFYQVVALEPNGISSPSAEATTTPSTITIAVAPQSVAYSISSGQPANCTVTAVTWSGQSTLNLSVSNVPSGMLAWFSTPQLNLTATGITQSSTLYFIASCSGGAPSTGAYTVTVVANTGGNNITVPVTLNIGN